MAYLPEVSTSPQDSLYVDGFSRQRVAGTGQRIDVNFIYDKQPDFFDEITSGASASVTHNANGRDLTLVAGTVVDTDHATMLSHPVPYTPGNSQLSAKTGVLDLADIGAGTVEVFLRSSSTTGSPQDLEVVTQANWDASLPGSIDWSKSHIFCLDFQSLKVGRIRFSLVREGKPEMVAEISNDNLRDHGYWQLPNLPVCYRIYNTATETISEIAYGDENNAVGYRHRQPINALASMKAICCTVKSEGGRSLHELPGLSRVTPLMAARVVSHPAVLLPVLSIRPSAAFKTFDSLVLHMVKHVHIHADESIDWVLLHQSVLTGAAWVDVDVAASAMQYDVSATAVSNGHALDNGFIYASSSGAKGTALVGAGSEASLLGKTVLWNRRGAETGTLTLAAIRAGSTQANVKAGFRWEELR